MQSLGLTPVEESGVVVHIGVHKTGTTSLQHALANAHGQLAAAGVIERSRWNRRSLLQMFLANSPEWRTARTDINAHSGRVVVSHESLCEASPEQARDFLTQVAGKRPVTVLITVRSLAALLPSTWQQLLKKGLSASYDEFLHEALDNVGDPGVVFWRRNDYSAVADRWAALVGLDRVVVAVSEKEFPERNLRVIEELCRVPAGTLTLEGVARTNSSMSFPEAEFLRAINSEVSDLPKAQYKQIVRMGAVPRLRAFDPDPERIPLPRWAAEGAAAEGQRLAEQLATSGVTIVGDIERIADAPTDSPDTVVPPGGINVAAAAGAVVGTLQAALKAVPEEQSAPAKRRFSRGR